MEDIEFDLTIGELTAHIFGYKIIEGLPLVCKKDSFLLMTICKILTYIYI